MSESPLLIHAGPRALARLRVHGLRAADVAVVPAAAGGPKGLILRDLDAWMFGEWLPSAPRERLLVGASIGAWRMAAACHPDAAGAFARLAELYCGQRYPRKPSPRYVSDATRDFLEHFIDGAEQKLANHPHNRLQVLTSRGLRWLHEPRATRQAWTGFGLAVCGNLLARRHLAAHLERVVFEDVRTPKHWPAERFDAFSTRRVDLHADNVKPALLASGTLPFIMEPVRGIPDAPAGTYWDGGLIDYHLALPYSALGENELVLYPHFVPRIVPGWFDKSLPWRHAARGPNRHWLDNVIMLSPSPSFLRRLPRGKLPDRNDFYHYGEDHEGRARDWKHAIAEGERLRDALAAFVERPDLSLVRPI